MSSITLSDLNAAVEETYKDFTVDLEDDRVLTFRPVLRLSKEKREEMKALREEKRKQDMEDVDVLVDFAQNYFRITAASKKDFDTLKRVLGDTPANWVKLFEVAMVSEDAGEA